jgi:uncharacterized protein YjiS (DUF1127 family)
MEGQDGGMDNTRRAEMGITALAELPRIAFQERQSLTQMWTATSAIWLRRMQTRRQLRELEKYRLADVGLTETQRCDECAKWFWQK